GAGTGLSVSSGRSGIVGHALVVVGSGIATAEMTTAEGTVRVALRVTVAVADVERIAGGGRVQNRLGNGHVSSSSKAFPVLRRVTSRYPVLRGGSDAEAPRVVQGRAPPADEGDVEDVDAVAITRPGRLV